MGDASTALSAGKAWHDITSTARRRSRDTLNVLFTSRNSLIPVSTEALSPQSFVQNLRSSTRPPIVYSITHPANIVQHESQLTGFGPLLCWHRHVSI